MHDEIRRPNQASQRWRGTALHGQLHPVLCHLGLAFHCVRLPSSRRPCSREAWWT